MSKSYSFSLVVLLLLTFQQLFSQETFKEPCEGNVIYPNWENLTIIFFRDTSEVIDMITRAGYEQINSLNSSILLQFTHEKCYTLNIYKYKTENGQVSFYFPKNDVLYNLLKDQIKAVVKSPNDIILEVDMFSIYQIEYKNQNYKYWLRVTFTKLDDQFVVSCSY